MAVTFSDIDAQGVALVGNPGAGKSTILNGIAGKSVFKSGMSLGTGLTCVLQTHLCEEGNLTLFDTPGLADIEKRKQAGKEIDKVLATDMSVKLAFVVTLEKGRVKPDDAATLRVVLEAIKSIDASNKFGVILNQLSPGELNGMNEQPEEAAKVRRGITGSFPTSHWIYLPRISELEDESDKKLMTKELISFFAALPSTKPADAEVDAIDTTGMEEKIQEQQKHIQELQEANEAQRAEMVKQLQLHKQEAEERTSEIRERLAELEVLLQEARREAERERYKHNRLITGIWNATTLAGGAITSLALANPAPLIAASAMCRTARKPKE